MARERSTWGETVALILRDCEPEARLEFMRSLGQWKRTSVATIKRNSDVDRETFEGDLVAAENRLVKLTALEEHLQRELQLDADMQALTSAMMRRAGF